MTKSEFQKLHGFTDFEIQQIADCLLISGGIIKRIWDEWCFASDINAFNGSIVAIKEVK